MNNASLIHVLVGCTHYLCWIKLNADLQSFFQTVSICEVWKMERWISPWEPPLPVWLLTAVILVTSSEVTVPDCVRLQATGVGTSLVVMS